MLRNLSKLTAKQIPEVTEKVGVILAPGPAGGSYRVSIEGNEYHQVWSVNCLSYPTGATVKVIMDRGRPTIVP